MAMSRLLNSGFAASFSVGVSSLFWCLRLKRFLFPSAFRKTRRFVGIAILPLFCRSCTYNIYNISISVFQFLCLSEFDKR